MTKSCVFICAALVACWASARGPATSTDYVRIYDPGIGESQPWYINDHCFIYGHDGRWHLFGITHPEPMNPVDEDQLAHASAETLTGVWRKEPYALTVRPDLNETYLWAPHVVKHRDTYYMYYCAGGWPSDQHQISLATSKDLYTWERYPDNPVIVDGYDARDAYVLNDGDRWILYYTATSTPTGGHHIVAAVTSTNLLDWSAPITVYQDDSTGTWGGPTESPTVVRRGDAYYLFIGPRDLDYRYTCVYRSQDPLNWTDDQFVARVNSHAAEVIRDLDGSWFVSHCGWGQGGVYVARLDWHDGLDAQPASHEPPASIAPEAVTTTTHRISLKAYRSKMLAGWIGQMVGASWSSPLSRGNLDGILPERDLPEWNPEMINQGFGQEDLYVEMTFLRSIQHQGLTVTARQAGIDVARSRYPLGRANQAARENLRHGIAPPDSGHPGFNPHTGDIDFRIVADVSGLLSPAMPARARGLAETFGSIMNHGDGVYGGAFVAAMYSLAFTEEDIGEVVTQALTCLPPGSRHSAAIRDAIRWHRQYPDDWEQTWHRIRDTYLEGPGRGQTSGDPGELDLDAALNGAFVVVGLLYGNGNIRDTIGITTRCGQASGSNASTAAGILFTLLGLERIPHEFKQVDAYSRFSDSPFDMVSLADVCEILSRRHVLMAGGTIEVGAFGEEILVIRQRPYASVRAATPQSRAPWKVTYTDPERLDMSR